MKNEFSELKLSKKVVPKQEKDGNPARQEKSQDELRTRMEERIKLLSADLDQKIADYRQAKKEGLFEDQDGETEGSGENRRKAALEEMNVIGDRGVKMRDMLDRGEGLPQFQSEISTAYKYTIEETDPQTNKVAKVEKNEKINIDIEQKITDFKKLYKDTGVSTPKNFEDIILNIWNDNYDAIQAEIEKYGFDEVLLIPPITDLADLAEKMKTTDRDHSLSDNFKDGGGWAGAKSQHTNQPRIVLVHKVKELDNHPATQATLGKTGQEIMDDPELGYKGILDLGEYLIFQKKYFDETGGHLDENKWVWLATKSGVRLVNAIWDSGRLHVSADGLDVQFDHLGARPSRSFS